MKHSCWYWVKNTRLRWRRWDQLGCFITSWREFVKNSSHPIKFHGCWQYGASTRQNIAWILEVHLMLLWDGRICFVFWCKRESPLSWTVLFGPCIEETCTCTWRKLDYTLFIKWRTRRRCTLKLSLSTSSLVLHHLRSNLSLSLLASAMSEECYGWLGLTVATRSMKKVCFSRMVRIHESYWVTRPSRLDEGPIIMSERLMSWQKSTWLMICCFVGSDLEQQNDHLTKQRLGLSLWDNQMDKWWHSQVFKHWCGLVQRPIV